MKQLTAGTESSLVAALESWAIELESSGPKVWSPRIDDVLEFVDLEIEHTPVLPGDIWTPKQTALTENGSYYVYDWTYGYGSYTDGRHTWNVEARTIREWRARFLVMRDEIFRTVVTGDYRNLPDLARYSVMRQVLPRFGIFWTPEGDLREAIAKHYREAEKYRYADGSILV